MTQTELDKRGCACAAALAPQQCPVILRPWLRQRSVPAQRWLQLLLLAPPCWAPAALVVVAVVVVVALCIGSVIPLLPAVMLLMPSSVVTAMATVPLPDSVTAAFTLLLLALVGRAMSLMLLLIG